MELKVIFLEVVYLDLYSDKVWGFSIFFILHTPRRYLRTAALKPSFHVLSSIFFVSQRLVVVSNAVVLTNFVTLLP